MSEPKILEGLQTVGMQISAGHLSDLLIKQQDLFHAEKAAVWRAGLLSSPWQHLDSTGRRVNGSNQHCHVLCNPLSSSSHTTPSKDRLSMLRVLLGGAELKFHFHAKALELLEHLGVSPEWRSVLTSHLGEEHVFTEEQLEAFLLAKQLRMGPAVRKLVKDALGIAASHTQTASPVIQLFLCDDAPQFAALTAELALCWIHEFRHDKKLVPHFSHHVSLLQDFGRQFWKLYHDLLDYRHHPTPLQAEALRVRFEQLFTHTSGSEA